MPADSNETSDRSTLDRITIDATNYPHGRIDYYILTTGDIASPSRPPNDEVINLGGVGRAIGSVWGGNDDAYEFEGSVIRCNLSVHRAIDPDADRVRVTVDGTEISPDNLDPGGVLGGQVFGPVHPELRIDRDEYDVVVSSADELVTAAEAGHQWIGYDADIDLGHVRGTRLTLDLPGQVLGAVPNSKGRYPTITVPSVENRRGNRAIDMTGPFARAHAVRIEGPAKEWVPERDGIMGWLRGLSMTGSWALVDHCEAWHFTHSGLHVGGRASTVTNCTSVRNQMAGLGYGVDINGGQPNVPYVDNQERDLTPEQIAALRRTYHERARPWNDRSAVLRTHLNANRHSIAGNGHPSYEIAYSHVGREVRNAFPIDCHQPGGHRCEVHHCTLDQPNRGIYDVDPHPAMITVRGTPTEWYRVRHNTFRGWGEEPKSAFKRDGQTVAQVCIGAVTRGWWREQDRPFENVHIRANRYNAPQDLYAQDRHPPNAAPSSGPLLPHEVLIEAQGQSARYWIELEEGGELAFGLRADRGDEVIRDDLRGARGSVGGRGSDSFLFAGELASVQHRGPIEATVDGEPLEVIDRDDR